MEITKKRGAVAGVVLAAAVAIGVAVYGGSPINLPPKPGDDDGDGIADSRDPCPWNAGPLDGKKPGCP